MWSLPSSVQSRRVEFVGRLRGLLSIVAGLVWVAPLAAQADDEAPRLRVFLDCQTAHCDFDHLRREILFADWVRDRESADVHVLVTGQTTGGGGTEFTLTLLERPDPAARTDTIVFATRDTDTEFEVRDQLTRVLALGLVRYAVQAGVIEHLRVAYEPGDRGLWPRLPATDPWDGWVFRVDGVADLSWSSPSEDQRSWTYDLSAGMSVSRVTNALKLELNGFVRRSHDEATLTQPLTGDELLFEHDGQQWSSAGLVAASVGRHWALGGQYFVEHTTGDDFNGELSEWTADGGPVIEYNVFPYEQSTRRLLAVRVSAGPAFRQFEGLFGPVTDWRAVSVLTVILAQQQPWGGAHAQATWSSVLSDPGDHRLSASASLEVRVYRGFALNLWGSAYRLAGTFHAGPATSAARRYQYAISFGPSFRFGSAYNNVVNPRLR
jgi:hypothetical protein